MNVSWSHSRVHSPGSDADQGKEGKDQGLKQKRVFAPIIEVTRGALVESVHLGAMALVDVDGCMHASWGDPGLVTYLRSTAKPLQALPVLESGVVEHYHLSLQQVALMCASHSGTDAHAAAAASIQTAIGVDEDDLLCGTHPPVDAETAQRLLRAGQSPTPNRHNCSGKHSGMLALARAIDAPIHDYVNPEHPVQKRILDTLAEMAEMDPQSIIVGVDGCSAPVFGMPLRQAALAYARLADPSACSASRQKACRMVFRAMNAHPEMVAGEGEFDTELMRASQGRLICKMGAEGYQGIALAPGALSPESPAMGLVFKIADGDPKQRARPLAALTVLETLGVLDTQDLEGLQAFGPRPVKNWRGLHVGQLRPAAVFLEALMGHGDRVDRV